MDEFQFRNDARKLQGLYHDLDQAKYAKLNARSERVMQARPGAQMPAQQWAMSLDVEMADRLMEVACDVRTYVAPGTMLTKDGPALCDFLALHAQPIADLDFGDDVHEEVRDQIRRLVPKLYPITAGDMAARPERYQSGRSIITRVRAMGHSLTPDQLRKWGERGHVSVQELPEKGGRGYRLSEVLERIGGGG